MEIEDSSEEASRKREKESEGRMLFSLSPGRN